MDSPLARNLPQSTVQNSLNLVALADGSARLGWTVQKPGKWMFEMSSINAGGVTPPRLLLSSAVGRYGTLGVVLATAGKHAVAFWTTVYLPAVAGRPRASDRTTVHFSLITGTGTLGRVHTVLAPFSTSNWGGFLPPAVAVAGDGQAIVVLLTSYAGGWHLELTAGRAT